MGADATLVNAAYAAAMAHVPGDWSKIFNKQYEGLLLAHTAKSKAFGDAFQKFGEVVGEIGKKANLAQEIREAEDKLKLGLDDVYRELGIEPQTIGELTTNNAKVGVEKHEEHYSAKKPANPAGLDAMRERFELLKEEIEKISNKKFLTKKDKARRTKLYNDFGIMKDTAIRNKALAIQYHKAGFGGENSLLNWDRMATLVDEGKLDGDLVTLIKHLHDPTANLEDYGTRVRFNDKNEMIIDYFVGRLGIEYTINNGGNIETMSSIMGPQTELTSKLSEQEFAALGPSNLPKVKSIKYEDLMGILKYKATGEEAGIEAVFTNVANRASEVIKGTKTPVYSKWGGDVDENGNPITGGLESESRRAIISELKNGDVVNDLATRPMFGTDRIYANDVDSIIDVLTYQKILGKDVSKFDINKDGEINRTELSAIGEDFLTNADRAKVKDVLIDPKTESELVIAQNEMADYFTNLAGQHFKNHQPKPKKLTAEEIAALKLKNKIKGFPWAPREPKDEFERKAYALVKAVNSEQPEIRDKDNDIWTKEIGTKWGEEPTVTYVNSTGKKRKSKIEMIQWVGHQTIYGDIPSDYAWSTEEGATNYGNE